MARRKRNRRKRNRSVASSPRKVTRRRRRRSVAAVATPTRRRRRRVVRRRRSRRSMAVVRVGRKSRRSGSRRRRSGVSGFGLSSLTNKETLMLAGGAIASGFLTNFTLGKLKASNVNLPMANSPVGAIAYRVAIPFVGAYFLRKYQPTLAKGLILGGVISGLQAGLEIAMSKAGGAVAGSSGMTDFMNMNSVGEYLSSPDATLPVSGALDYGAMNTDQFGGIMDSENAFESNPW